ncbi:MAG TPA: glycosyltransferase family 39 protein, partial [bacterium]|nr:glycosyltransferase family 39 protein [bacterium]
CWPTLDEGWNGILALELSKHWTWRFFYTFGQAPPLPVWTAALLLKLGWPPALCLWFPSAVVSLLTVVMGYWAARQFFSKSFSLVCGGLLAFSYWPLFLGRFCHQGIWLPMWVCGVFFLWGRYLKSNGETSQRIWAIFIGLGMGLGSFTFTPWMGIAGIFLLSVLWSTRAQLDKDRLQIGLLLLGLVVGLLPFLLAVRQEGYGQHILSLSPWGGWFHGLDFFTNFFKYFAVLVWGAFEKDPAYTPIWGGFLNPLLGAFFFVGCLELVAHWRSGVVRWVTAAFFLFLLPGALSPNLETFRVAQVLPLLLFITAIGIHTFFGSIPVARRVASLFLVMILVGAFDFSSMAAPYRNPEIQPENFGRPLKSLEHYRAYQALEKAQEEKGPGAILASFDTNAFNDPTLPFMSRVLSSAMRGGIPKWVAVFVNENYEPFLKKRYPAGNWIWVGKGLSLENGGELLGIIPFEALTPEDKEAWIATNWDLQKADLQRFSQSSGRLDKSVEILSNASSYKFDPFLESVYWDKMGAYAYENLDYDSQMKAYQNSLSRGYPTADLYFKMGQLFLVKQQYGEARKAFLKATQAPLDLTPSRTWLDWLDHQPKNTTPNPGH